MALISNDPFFGLRTPLPNDIHQETFDLSGVPLPAARFTPRSERSPEDYADALIKVGKEIAVWLKGSSPLTKEFLRSQMEKNFGGSDAEGAWIWKDVYEAQEVGLVALLMMAGRSLKAMPPDQAIAYLKEKQSLCITHTFRSEEQQLLQQFSTPLPLAYLVAVAAGVSPQDSVLEPSAGTGILAAFGKIYGAQAVAVNEIAENRSAILSRIFAGSTVTTHNAEYLNDYLDPEIRPSVILMNPPFSRRINMKGQHREATYKHVRAALMRLAPGGRLVLISGDSFSPHHENSKDSFTQFAKYATLQCSLSVSGAAYKCHGTTFQTRLSVFDKVPTTGHTTDYQREPLKSAELLSRILSLPPRIETEPEQKKEVVVGVAITPTTPTAAPTPAQKKAPPPPEIQKEPWSFPPESVQELSYVAVEFPVFNNQLSSSELFEAYSPQRVNIPQAIAHPTDLCESAALASVLPPMPSYKPLLSTKHVSDGILSSAQLESVIYAGQAHESFLQGTYTVDETFDDVSPTTSDDPKGVRFRRGWFLGDGTGAGKGRQIAGILMDNHLRGREKALWFSKSATLIEDAKRDWSDLGGNPDDIVSLSNWKLDEDVQGAKILFCTYATLRSERYGKSRFHQIVDWAGPDFDGVMAFDESHELGNAVGAVSDHFGAAKAPSQQGLKGLRLQNALPNARVVYVSATGASEVSNLAYASRLGLWGTGEFPFASRSDFIETINAGGIAAMEVVCRDLKALGLYASRSLSFNGVEYQPLDVPLTPRQVEVYQVFAEAFKVIHNNLKEALLESGVVGATGTLNAQAKAAASSRFEGVKQSFFNYVLTSMKVPKLIEAIERDLEEGYAPVIQLVHTNESLLKDRLLEIPVSEYHDLNVDITPLAGVIRYLQNSFPIYLYQEYTGSDGKVRSELAKDSEGNPIICQAAVAIRDSLIEKVASVPALPGPLEQLLHHFGHDDVAEVTGRSLRLLKERESGKIFVAKRSGNANSEETLAFMNGEKRILVFSNAGGTGRSYHASLAYPNQDRRKHYLLEAGWRAEEAVQGLGRTHRTHQESPPIFCPIYTDVKGEQRFKSSIEKRISSLGALTRGQSKAGGQGVFNDTGNLESIYAQKALHHFYSNLHCGVIKACSLAEFEDLTGLKLTTDEGALHYELPPIQRFLNRLLALPIPTQNALFGEFDALHQGVIEAAIASGHYETGMEVLKGEKFVLVNQEVIHRHPVTGSESFCSEIEKTERTEICYDTQAENILRINHGTFLVNSRSGKVAVGYPTTSVTGADGMLVARVALQRPTRVDRVLRSDFEKSNWQEATRSEWLHRWNEEVNAAEPFTTHRIFAISGLLLPLWNAMSDYPKVYRINLDDGDRILGQVIEPEQMAKVQEAIGLKSRSISLTPQEIYRAVYQGGQSIEIGGGLSFRRSHVQGDVRIEIVGDIGEVLDRLRIAGCFTEMVSYRFRAFISTREDQAAKVIEKVQQLFR